MKKAIIIGCPGGGKSTFARALAEKTSLPLYHLDNMYWKSDRTHVEKSVFYKQLEEVMKTDSWIIDGNYNATMEKRLNAADTVFFLDYPVEVCLEGVEKRKGTVRTDLPWVETKDDRDDEFISFVTSFRENSRPRILELLSNCENKTVVTFTARAEADEYLKNLS